MTSTWSWTHVTYKSTAYYSPLTAIHAVSSWFNLMELWTPTFVLVQEYPRRRYVMTQLLNWMFSQKLSGCFCVHHTQVSCNPLCPQQTHWWYCQIACRHLPAVSRDRMTLSQMRDGSHRWRLWLMLGLTGGCGWDLSSHSRRTIQLWAGG